MYKNFLKIITLTFLLSSCNAAMVGGFAEGMNRGLSSPSQNASSDLRKMKRDMQEQKDELEKIKNDMRWECIGNGGVPIGNKCMK